MISLNKNSLFLSIVSILVLGLGASGFYYYEQNELTKARLSSLEVQVTALAEAMKDSNTVSEANKLKLQELANRREVITKSQDDLLTAAVAKASPAVVSIVVSKDVPLLEVQYVNPFGDDPFFRDIGFRVPTYRQIGTQKKQIGAGTGFLVREDGYIISNKHVVNDTQAEYVALLSTGEQKVAQVIYRDTEHDLAILKITGSSYTSLALGDSGQLKLGQTVVAIGNALGEYNNSVSVGIISGLDRTIQAQDNRGKVLTLKGVIQTDATINPGNSGGPLLDLSGKIIGVNVATEIGANSIAFAIPVDAIKPLMNRVLP